MRVFILYIKYISLLLYSGLILALYNSGALKSNKPEKPMPEKIRIITTHHKTDPVPFSFFNDVMVIFFPALKS